MRREVATWPKKTNKQWDEIFWGWDSSHEVTLSRPRFNRKWIVFPAVSHTHTQKKNKSGELKWAIGVRWSHPIRVTACHPGNDPFQSDPYSHNIFFCHRRNPSHPICMVFTSLGWYTIRKRQWRRRGRTEKPPWPRVLSDTQSAASRMPKPRRIAALATVCFISYKSHFPFALRCLVVHHGPTRFEFPRRLFPASVNHSLSDSRPLLRYRGAVTEYEPDFFWLPPPFAMWTLWENDLLLLAGRRYRNWQISSSFSFTLIPLRPSNASMSSVSTRWFTRLLSVSSNVVAD